MTLPKHFRGCFSILSVQDWIGVFFTVSPVSFGGQRLTWNFARRLLFTVLGYLSFDLLEHNLCS